MLLQKQQLLTKINDLKNGDDKHHEWIKTNLIALAPERKALDRAGLEFHTVVTYGDEIVDASYFRITNDEELERYIDNYIINDILTGRAKDYDLPEDFDADLLEEKIEFCETSFQTITGRVSAEVSFKVPQNIYNDWCLDELNVEEIADYCERHFEENNTNLEIVYYHDIVDVVRGER